MSTIGGPGGIRGPKGPNGPDGPESPDGLEGTESAGAPDRASEPSRASGPRATSASTAASATSATSAASDIERIAADLRAGRLTPNEAVDRLVGEVADTEALASADRAELRELMTDLIANDPHLAALVGRLG